MTAPAGEPGRGGATPPPDPPPADTTALLAWEETGEQLVRGLAHQLSNRVGTVSALAEALAATDPANRLATALTVEASQLEELLRLYRLLPRDPGRGVEPVRLQDVVRDALALAAHHPRARGAITGPAEEPATMAVVRAHVPSVLHALLILLDAALPAASGGGEPAVRVTIEAAGERVGVRVAGPGLADDAGRAARARRAAAALVAADGGTVPAEEGGMRLDLPALAPRTRAARDD